MADHNDPNAVNSIFSDIDISAADLYDLFGFPGDATTAGEQVVVALTFASIPATGVFDTDILYRILFNTAPRVARSVEEESLEGLLRYFDSLKDKYLGAGKAAEIRVTVDAASQATVKFVNFPGGSFSTVVATNKVLTIPTPKGHSIKAFIGGRDDAFFNDLTGFFRSINYAPQFYHVPHAMTEAHELDIPKTLLELEGNDLFNHDSGGPEWGYGEKKDLPPGPHTWKGTRFRKDARGNFRFVYTGKDCQAGINVNAIILEIPLAFLTDSPAEHRIVNTWGESWVLKAAHKVETIPDDPFWLANPSTVFDTLKLDAELKKYKLVDTDGQPFADAGLSEREDSRQVGANNFWLAPHFIKRLAHLGWGFGPSISALGLRDRVRPRQRARLGAPEVRVRPGGVSAGQEDPVPGAEHARRHLEQEGSADPAPARVRGVRPERLRHRHGHDRNVAVWPATRRSGGHAVPVAVPRHEGGVEEQEVPRRLAERPVPVGCRADRAEDAPEPAEERQGIPGSLPVSGGAVVGHDAPRGSEGL